MEGITLRTATASVCNFRCLAALRNTVQSELPLSAPRVPLSREEASRSSKFDWIALCTAFKKVGYSISCDPFLNTLDKKNCKIYPQKKGRSRLQLPLWRTLLSRYPTSFWGEACNCSTRLSLDLLQAGLAGPLNALRLRATKT